jgi:dihydroorotase
LVFEPLKKTSNMILIKKGLILDTASPHHNQRLDILVEKGKITKIEANIEEKNAKIINAENAFVALGFVDIGTQVGDPGFEHREDVDSAAAAAAYGGFTTLAVQPNTQPTIHSKSEVLYLKNKTKNSIVDFLPIGAASQDCKGENISEMYDMHEAGAIAFSDGAKTIKDSGLMLRALQYIKAFGGLLINHPIEKNVAAGGQMHEGVMSTSLGIKGIPSLAEELMLVRDLYLVEYADSQLHIQNISTARSVDLVRQAKKKGLRVTASVPAINLAFDDDSLVDFDTHLKVSPPLRAQSDIEILKKGLADGTIDCITSNHVPLDEEAWNLEFTYADFGAIGLETAVSVANTYAGLSAEKLVDKFSTQPRKILKMNDLSIKIDSEANLTIFDTSVIYTYGAKDIFSKSKNSPFLGKTLQGKTLAVLNNGKSKIF